MGLLVLGSWWVSKDLFVWALFIWIPMALGLHITWAQREELTRRLLGDGRVQDILMRAARRQSKASRKKSQKTR